MGGKKKSKQVKRQQRKGGKRLRTIGARAPTLVMKDHLMISQNVTAVNLKQINLAFTLANFPNALVQSSYYEQYRFRKISYKVLPLDIVNTVQSTGATWSPADLVYSYTVPLTTSIVPAPAESAYLAFKHVQVNLETKLRSRSYVPFFQTGSAPNYVMARSPLLDCANKA